MVTLTLRGPFCPSDRLIKYGITPTPNDSIGARRVNGNTGSILVPMPTPKQRER